MLNCKRFDNKKPQKKVIFNPEKIPSKYKKLASMGRISKGIINEICDPVDAANRFINLTLQELDENSQGREFLLESKKGVKKISALLEKLNCYTKKIEEELSEISSANIQNEYSGAKP